MCFSLCSCGGAKGKAALDGKRVLFVGCSFTYYGGTVNPAGSYNYEDLLQAERVGDNGFFYQLCKDNGIDVDVTDWTFGGHNLKEILGGKPCTNNDTCEAECVNGHLADLTDRNFDCVILNEIRRDGDSAEAICDSIKSYADIFKEANPDVDIYYIVHDGVYVSGYDTAWLESLELIKELGVTVLDWGTLVWDAANGKTSVPGATLTYQRNTFMVSQKKDRYHPNILTGYLYALMTYCAITGESAVGQPYGFCYDKNHEAYPISERFDIENYKLSFYTYNDWNTEEDESETNFDQVFASAADMNGLQQLVDTYLDEDTEAWKAYLS